MVVVVREQDASPGRVAHLDAFETRTNKGEAHELARWPARACLANTSDALACGISQPGRVRLVYDVAQHDACMRKDFDCAHSLRVCNRRGDSESSSTVPASDMLKCLTCLRLCTFKL